jgi:toxin ParE1/3/4
MKVKIFIGEEAEADIAEAHLWYENQRQGLGSDFLLCVEASLNQIQRNPDAFQVSHRNIRRSLLRRFPYGIFYVRDGNAVNVIAVFHVKRNPTRWKQRS